MNVGITNPYYFYMKLKLFFFMAALVCSLSSCGKGAGNLLSPVEFSSFLEENGNVVLLDVRTPEEFAGSHLPGAENIDFDAPGFVDAVKARVPAGSEIALYCRSGRRSAEAARELEEAGYSVKDLDGGILAWEKAGLPVTDGTIDTYTTPGGKTVEIQPLIHASIRIAYDGKEIEIDPVGTLGDRTTDYSRFPKADLILITHEHHDHLDPGAVKTLSKADTLVIANPNSVAILGEGVAMKNGETRQLGDDISVEAVPAYNTTPGRLQFHPEGRDNGYVLTLDGLRIYIAGDTEVIPEMKDLKGIDIAFLPCNLPYTMTPEQLIEAAKIIRPKVLYPYHFGTTDLSGIVPALAPLGIDVRIRPFDP